MYYLRTRAAADAIKFTVDTQSLARNNKAVTTPAADASAAAPAPAPAAPEGGLSASGSGSSIDEADAMMEREKQLAAMVCSLENKDACLMCGS
jgi:ribonucleoside-diphosphate reductase subunit M1